MLVASRVVYIPPVKVRTHDRWLARTAHCSVVIVDSIDHGAHGDVLGSITAIGTAVLDSDHQSGINVLELQTTNAVDSLGSKMIAVVHVSDDVGGFTVKGISSRIIAESDPVENGLDPGVVELETHLCVSSRFDLSPADGVWSSSGDQRTSHGSFSEKHGGDENVVSFVFDDLNLVSPMGDTLSAQEHFGVFEEHPGGSSVGECGSSRVTSAVIFQDSSFVEQFSSDVHATSMSIPIESRRVRGVGVESLEGTVGRVVRVPVFSLVVTERQRGIWKSETGPSSRGSVTDESIVCVGDVESGGGSICGQEKIGSGIEPSTSLTSISIGGFTNWMNVSGEIVFYESIFFYSVFQVIAHSLHVIGDVARETSGIASVDDDTTP